MVITKTFANVIKIMLEMSVQFWLTVSTGERRLFKTEDDLRIIRNVLSRKLLTSLYLRIVSVAGAQVC